MPAWPQTLSSIAIVLVLGAATARAQPASSSAAPAAAHAGRGFLKINGGYRPGATTFVDAVRVTHSVEPGEIDTDYRVKAAPGIDVAGGVRVWRQLAAGIDVAYFSRAGAGAVTAEVPHPLYFTRPRQVEGETGTRREELAVHAQAVWMMPLTGRWRLDLAGGPSFFNVRQRVVDDVSVTETYPFDAATLAAVVTRRVTKSGVGFNAGADVSYMFSPKIGVGATTTFSRARIALRQADGHDLKVNAGGPHVGVGLRIRF